VLRRLTSRREYDLDLIGAVKMILNTSSFRERAEIFCHFTVERTERLTGPKETSGRQIEDRYRELLARETKTAQEELRRRQELVLTEMFFQNHLRNLSQCEEAVGNGMQRMPTDVEFRKRLKLRVKT